MDGRVTFHGFVLPDRVREAMQSALALVAMSRFEGMPNAVVEAMRAFGVEPESEDPTGSEQPI